MVRAASTSPSEPEFEKVEPRASSLVESLRAFGYSPQAAIADLVDNSITARAKNIWVNFVWAGVDTHMTILDDGVGMDEPTLREAMRPGTLSPLEKRDLQDLGRFGLGLKTASFSQCRRLTVSSRRGGQMATRAWDLDYIGRTGEWRLLKNVDAANANKLRPLEQLRTGTIVLWERLDRLFERAQIEDAAAHKRFLQMLDDVELHLRMVFHRYLAASIRQRTTIWINGRKLAPWDPFMLSNSSTDRRPVEHLRTGKRGIGVSPFILPHISMQTAEEKKTGGGPQGWNAQQGFYVYRNDRLLVAGSWLGLGFVKEEHYKLARIAIDLPNTMDHEWDINVTKSRATPPGELRDDLMRIAKDARARAVALYRFRGKIAARIKSSDWVYVWSRNLKMDGDRVEKFQYSINRNHPLIAEVLSEAEPATRKRVELMLKVIEETLPVTGIAVDSSEHPDAQPIPFEKVPTTQVTQVLRVVLDALLAKGMSKKDAFKRLQAMEPFDRYPELIEALREERA